MKNDRGLMCRFQIEYCAVIILYRRGDTIGAATAESDAPLLRVLKFGKWIRGLSAFSEHLVQARLLYQPNVLFRRALEKEDV